MRPYRSRFLALGQMLAPPAPCRRASRPPQHAPVILPVHGVVAVWSNARRVVLARLLVDLERQLGVDVSAIVTGHVGQLGVTALRAAHIVDGLERVVRSA